MDVVYLTVHRQRVLQIVTNGRMSEVLLQKITPVHATKTRRLKNDEDLSSEAKTD